MTTSKTMSMSWASDSSGEITNACDVVIGAPSAQFGGNPQWRTRLEEGSGPDADRVRAGEQHLGRVATGADAAGTDDRRVRSIASPITVFTNVSPVAPASTAARAISTMSVTFGESLANTGSASPSVSTTRVTAARVASAECANT